MYWVAMQYSILVDGGNITLDEKVDCRKIIDGFIYLGRFVDDRNKTNIEYTPVKVGVTAYYYLNIGCLILIRSIQGDSLIDHRSGIMAWNGGLVAHMEVDHFLSESLPWAAARLKDVENFQGGKFSKFKFEPAESLLNLFNVKEPSTPAPMEASPVAPEPEGVNSLQTP